MCIWIVRFFLVPNNIPLSECTQFIYPFTPEGHSDCFQSLAVLNKAATRVELGPLSLCLPVVGVLYVKPSSDLQFADTSYRAVGRLLCLSSMPFGAQSV